MRTRRSRPAPVPRPAFAGFCFPPEMIVLAVRWYLRFSLSYRDVEELLAERGIEVDHVTVYRVMVPGALSDASLSPHPVRTTAAASAASVQFRILQAHPVVWPRSPARAASEVGGPCFGEFRVHVEHDAALLRDPP